MNVIISNNADEELSSLNIDVIKKLKGEFSSEEIVSMFENFFYEKMILDITAIKDYDDLKNIQTLSMNLDADKLIILLDGSQKTSSNEYISGLISMGIYNFTKNKEGVMYLISHTNTYKDVASLQKLDDKPDVVATKQSGSKIIGIKNVTEHAGATSFIYMMKRELSKNYKVLAIELDKKDFVFFNDKNMISVSSIDFSDEVLKRGAGVDIILVDLNNSNQSVNCNDILYLLEPSTIKINKLVVKNMELLKSLVGKKIILNKNMLTPRDISEFEMEAGIKTYYAIPPINDRVESIAMEKLLMRMGLLMQREDIDDKPAQNKLFGLFNRRNNE